MGLFQKIQSKRADARIAEFNQAVDVVVNDLSSAAAKKENIVTIARPQGGGFGDSEFYGSVMKTANVRLQQGNISAKLIGWTNATITFEID